jgi:hypothetical protein
LRAVGPVPLMLRRRVVTRPRPHRSGPGRDRGARGRGRTVAARYSSI